jgi:Fur family ferric uptake transcriptional regulator
MRTGLCRPGCCNSREHEGLSGGGPLDPGLFPSILVENGYQYHKHDMSAQAWLEHLQEEGYRLTPARKAVVETVAASRRAMTPLQVFDAARKRYRRLGLVSVYRTLERLEAMGLVQRVHQAQDCQGFIAAAKGHQHLLLCERCGRVTLFEGDDLQTLFRSIARKTGYRIHGHWLQVSGLCESCQRDLGGVRSA